MIPEITCSGLSRRVRTRTQFSAPFVAFLFMLFPAFLAIAASPESWPEFRGPLGNGMVTLPGITSGIPLQWSETEHVAWKTSIPLQGWSSPVIFGNQIWLTSATEDGHDFFAICVDKETGQILRNDKLFHSDNPEPLGNNVNSYASPSPAIEAGRVYVHFGSYGTACLDTDTGKVLWERKDLPCRHYRGPGSSVVLFENLLLLTFDGADVQYLAALDKDTGQTVWKTDRTTVWTDLDAEGKPEREGDFRKAFTTPLVVDGPERAILYSPGTFSTFAYDARTGRELWKTHHAAYSPAPRPIYGNGLVYILIGRGTPELWAMRPGGEGDVTDTHIAWKASGKIIPLESSPLLVDNLLYLLSNDGAVTCLNSMTGEQLWSEKIGGNYMASPIYADGRIYCPSVQGKMTVLREGKTFEILAVNELDDGFMASPAVTGKALFLRTKTHLYRIENQ